MNEFWFKKHNSIIISYRYFEFKFHYINDNYFRQSISENELKALKVLQSSIWASQKKKTKNLSRVVIKKSCIGKNYNGNN